MIVFDLDGTLVDSAADICKALDSAFQKCGVRPRVPISAAIVGPPLTHIINELAGTNDARLLKSIREAFTDDYDASGFLRTVPYRGIPEMLSQLHAAGYRMCVATNKRARPTRTIIERNHWTQYFQAHFSIDSIPKAKNKTDILRYTIDHFGLEGGAAVYVGDRPEDEHAASAAGMNFIAVAWGYGDTAWSMGIRDRQILTKPDFKQIVKMNIENKINPHRTV